MKPAPRSFRDILDLFQFYHEEVGLEALIDTIDLTDVLPRQIYYAVHGRPPDTIEEACGEQHYPIKAILAAKLLSTEFRESFITNALAAFPEKQRLLFIHIPKSAGSNLSSHLVSQFASFNTTFAEPGVASDEQFLRLVKAFALELRISDQIYIHGHNHLQRYEDWGAIRQDDQVFTVLRDPQELIVSQVNYVLTRMVSVENPIPADTAGWRAEFGYQPGTELSRPDLLALAARILAHDGVVPTNVMCRYLGDGIAQHAAERLVTRNIEVTTMPHYAAWCRDRWGIATATQRNKSETFLRWADYTAEQQAYILGSNAEDKRVYDWVNRQIDAAGANALTGRALLPVNIVSPAPAAAPSPNPNLASLMTRFESLGENCEFGLLQRRCGAEPLGLLRWASAPYDKLLRAVKAGFAGLGAPENLRIELSGNGREYMVADLCYGFYTHAWVLKDEATPEEVHTRETRRIPFLVRKLLEDLAAGDKLFVYHGMSPLTEQQARELAKALRFYGPTTLFWIELANDIHPAGTVTALGNGLIKGHIERFAPIENAHDFALPPWITLCHRALALLEKT